MHTRVTHSDCPLNKKNKTLDINPDAALQSEQQSTRKNIEKRLCQCGSNQHERISHRHCQLNPKIILSQANTQTFTDLNDNNKKCRCGSTSHQRITHSDCILNKNRISNSQSNQIEDPTDLQEFFEATTSIDTEVQTSTLK